MNLNDFWQKNENLMKDFIAMSHGAAARADYIQGGGGNTSVKLPGGLMAIKASGFSMGDISKDNAYAVLDGERIRRFYLETDPATLGDIEGEGSAITKANTLTVEGLPSLRPSVEAGFHAVLDRFVLHSHSVYANLAACSQNGAAIFAEAMAKADYGYAFVPYVDPGARLTFCIRDAMRRAEGEQGKKTALLLLENHGVIAHADDVATADRIHEDANDRLARRYTVGRGDFPQIAIQPSDGEQRWLGNTPWLQERLAGSRYGLDFFTAESLYPDQMVFLGGNLAFADTPEAAAASQFACCVDRSSGHSHYRCPQSQALVIEQTLCCVLFVVEKILARGEAVHYMDAAGKDFIANWESEKYRQSLVEN